MRIKYSFQFAQDPDVQFADSARQETFFGQSDAVLAADRAAKLDGIGKDLCHGFVDPADFVRVSLIGEKSWMKIAITEMTECSNS